MLFVIFVAVSTSFLLIFYTIPKETYLERIYAILALITFVVIVSALAVALVFVLHKKLILEPIEKLSEAAKEVANGNLDIKLSPVRKNGKVDELQILFDNFNTMVAELASTEILKKDFVSNVSHELKTPLAVIQNYSTMLQGDGLTEDERKNYAAKIGEATKKLSVLVTDILALSRLENQKIVVNKKKYNLSEQLYRCSLGFEQVWEDKNIEINIHCDENIELYSDENLLDIVWNNLLSNAFKFTPPNGAVTVTCEADGNFITVTVTDSGLGMSEQDIKHIFDKFYQADTSHKTKGNGLGLALVREILILIKAEVAVDSTLGKGSRFTVKIPIND